MSPCHPPSYVHGFSETVASFMLMYFQEHRKESGEIYGTYEDLDKYKKVPVVKGFTIEVDHGNEPLNYYEKYKPDFNDENCIIYVQTNNTY